MHTPENTFDRAVERFLCDAFDATDEQLAYQPRLSETYRMPDFLVQLPDVTFAVEVENDFEAAFEGVGQAICYAGHFEHGVPVVVLPEGHVEQPEYDLLRQQAESVQFYEVPKEYE